MNCQTAKQTEGNSFFRKLAIFAGMMLVAFFTVMVTGCKSEVEKAKEDEAAGRAEFADNYTTLLRYTGRAERYDIPACVKKIENSAFNQKDDEEVGKRIKTVTIPNSVTTIGEDAFWGCRSLTSVTIPNSVTTIGNYAFSGCKSLTSVTIPNSVTTIGDEAFSGCKSLTSVTIPNSVTTIGEGAFFCCDALTSVTIQGHPKIGVGAFLGCPGDPFKKK